MPAARQNVSRIIARQLAPFTGAAVLAFVLVVPGSDLRLVPYVAAAVTTVIVTAFTILAPWPRLPATARVAPSLLFLLSVALLRQSAGGATAGVSILVLLPVFWQALHGTRRLLAIVVAGVGVYFVAPIILIGGAEYPATQLRSAALFLVVAALVGGTVQRLVAQVRRDARASHRRERDLERVAAVARALPASADARQEICAAACELSGATFAILFEPDGETQLTSTATSGLGPGAVTLQPTREPSAASLAFTGRRPLFIGDPEHHPAMNQRLWGLHGRPACMLFEPVLRGEDAVGVLVLGWSQPVGPQMVIRLLAAEAASAIERSDLMTRLADLAATDPLTALPNRRVFDQALQQSVRAGERACVAMLDLDHFKAFNDVNGHQAGDRLLKAAASAWAQELRPGDVLSRYGGEEFAVLLPGCELAGATVVVERLRAALPAGVTCSAGVVRWDGRESPAELVHRADTALYAAKNAGRDRAVAV